MEITFLRHAETEYNVLNVFSGRTNCDLTQNGINKTIELRSIFTKPFDYYYCSSLSRSQQTLNLLFPNVIPIIDDRIIEIDYGILEGKNKKSISINQRENLRNGTYTPKNGESKEHIIQRVSEFLNHIFSTYTHNEKILVVTHAGILRYIKKFLKPSRDLNSDNLSYFTILAQSNFLNFNKGDFIL